MRAVISVVVFSVLVAIAIADMPRHIDVVESMYTVNVSEVD
jgi:hypothetical protein